jgi:hypothetical protein
MPLKSNGNDDFWGFIVVLKVILFVFWCIIEQKKTLLVLMEK